MLIKQISVFIENKAGKVAKIIDILGENNIDISALSIADAADFGILRLIVDDVEKASKVLAANDYLVKTTSVISIGIENKPGGLVKILKTFKENDIAIDYMYAFVNKDNSAVTIIRADNTKLAMAKLEEAGIE